MSRKCGPIYAFCRCCSRGARRRLDTETAQVESVLSTEIVRAPADVPYVDGSGCAHIHRAHVDCVDMQVQLVSMFRDEEPSRAQ